MLSYGIVLEWYRKLDVCTRLELMVQMLQILNPCELRFVGICLEDLARIHAQNFKDSELRANNCQNWVNGLVNLDDPDTRALLITALSLLHRSNHTAATALYRLLSSTLENVDFWSLDEQFKNHLHLMVTLIRLHPAFSFNQKRSIQWLFSKLASSLVESNDNENDTQTQTQPLEAAVEGSVEFIEPVENQTDFQPEATSAGEICPRCRRKHNDDIESWTDSNLTSVRSDMLQPPPVYVTGIELCPDLGIEDRSFEDLTQSTSHQVPLKVSWSDNSETTISKSFDNFYEFHLRLLDLFPREAGCHGNRRVIPYLPTFDHSDLTDPDSSLECCGLAKNKEMVRKYIDDLLTVPPRLLGCPYAWEFFGRTLPPIPSQSSESTSLCLKRLFERNPPFEMINNEIESEPKEEVETPVVESSSTTDEDRDLCVQNGTVKTCTFLNSSVSSASEAVTKNSESGQVETSNENEPKTTENSVIQRSSSPVTSDSHLIRSFPVHHNTQRKYSDYVPQPFFGIIRRLNLLSYKPSLARFSLEEVCSMTKDDIIEKVEVQSGDLDKLIDAVTQLREQLSCNGINRGGQNAFYNHRKPLLHTVIRTQNSTPEENWDNEALNGPSLIRPRSSSSAGPSKIPTNSPVRNGLSGSADDVARGLPPRRGFHGSRGRGRFFRKVTPTQGWLENEAEFPPMGHKNSPSQGLTQSLTLPSQTLSLPNSQSVSPANTDDCEILPIEQQMAITPPNLQQPPPTQMVWSQAAPQSASWFQNPKNPIHATSWLPGVIQPTPQIPFSTTMSCHCGRHGCVLCHPTFRPMMLPNNYLHNPHPQNMLQALAAIGAMPLPMPMGILPPQHFPLEEQARFHHQESMDERMMMGQQHMKKLPGGGTESCCNCGQQHPFDLCQQPSLRDLTKSGEYRLNFDGDSAPADTSESVKT